ncbi:hypothetical protein ACUHOQ_001262 [Pseudomonas aeruginosa]|uniref:hypothetical protein n=1 Tax=Pseudomonas aeruginosa TaxID=287 RepID=UPI000BB94915|nr:hypothetical protein [Pseudomonas aeruginosa]EKY1809565.1 hypothetical protein [Pseudomonas aeruginosa]MBI6969221.1 hypothetical protein [Pseudomonas aeruginosa]MBV5917945.1 hypothetical protein [Pseudomonas aeruginosa]MBX6224673.1 hypothetical protein [Pseudomonas aeruginosa]MCO2995734.1 hypothetical protein [Pseudomonas aeruginosa]
MTGELKLEALLQFNKREVLTHAGNIGAQVAERLAQAQYAEFDARRDWQQMPSTQAQEQIQRQLERKVAGRKK